jgi:DNA-binding transcriptional LysR family regulator
VLHETESLQTNIGLIAAGLRVSLLPASIRSLKRAGVVYRHLAPPVPHVELAAPYEREDASEIAKAFLEILREGSRR